MTYVRLEVKLRGQVGTADEIAERVYDALVIGFELEADPEVTVLGYGTVLEKEEVAP